jgi:hypothetical protein
MNNAPPPPKNRYASGPVWCEARGRSAVVSLVTPVANAGPPYIQWCSLVGTNIACDESCVCRSAKWVADEVDPAEGLSRTAFDPIREIVVDVRATVEQVPMQLECWIGWASAFTAGMSSAARAWRAAEEALREAAKFKRDATGRLIMLAAADAAWAAVHAAAGNRSLALESTLRARQLLKAAAPGGAVSSA